MVSQRIVESVHGDILRSTMDLDQSQACNGQFEEEYQPLKAVGKGAFGFVWKALRCCDGQEVRKSPLRSYMLPLPWKPVRMVELLGC